MKSNIKRIIIAVLLSIFIIGCTVIMKNRGTTIHIDNEVDPEATLDVPKDSIK